MLGDTAVAETKGLELGQTVLSGAELDQNLVPGVEHFSSQFSFTG